MMSSLTFAAVAALCSVAISSPLVQEASTPRVGRAVGAFHPELELPTVDGERTVRLSDFRGKKLLLIEFASW